MTAAETLQHILDEHRMGTSGCDVPNDPELSDVLGEIQANPVGWHQADHDSHGVPLDADHSKIEWGA